MTIEQMESEITETKRRTQKVRELLAAQTELTELEIRAGVKPRISIAEISQLVSDHFGIPLEVIRSRARPANVASARQTIYYLAEIVCGYKCTHVAIELGLDHGTIIHGVRAVKNRRDVDAHFATDLLALVRRCSIAALPQPAEQKAA